ncbi:MAG: hypothetical protein Q8L27_00720 [archaeon]|nr:hypothetical protein [archaeon]
MNFKKYFFYVLFVILALIVCLWVFRIFAERQVDDIGPLISCEADIIDKSETLMVIPIFNGIGISENKTWCDYILSLNKTLGMHGVYHTYQEFLELRNESYVRIGMGEFKKCFGFYPEIFEAPQLAFNGDNAEVLRESMLKFRGYPYSLTHKVYHCQDSGKYSNRFIDFF